MPIIIAIENNDTAGPPNTKSEIKTNNVVTDVIIVLDSVWLIDLFNISIGSLPNISEELNVRRDLAILEYTGGYLHIPTISTAGSVDLIRNAKNKKLNVTCSTSIHNIFFNDSKDVELIIFP